MLVSILFVAKIMVLFIYSIRNKVILKSIVKFADKNIYLGLYGIELDLDSIFSDCVCGGAVAFDICRRCNRF